jgi:hypothetical protein
MMAATPYPRLAYLWEPFSRVHRPGICNARFPYWFPYICAENGAPFIDSIGDMLAFRYKAQAEARAMRGPKDAGRLARDWARFRRYRLDHAVPLMKDPIAVFSAEWLCDTFDMDVVVLVRHPAAFAHSLQRRGLAHPFGDFLRQPLLLRDLLGAYEPEIRRHAAEPQPVIDQAVLLWNMVHSVVQRYRDRHTNWAFLRLEDVSRDPTTVFRDLFTRYGLTFNERVETTILEHTGASNPAQVASASSVQRDSAASILAWKTALTRAEIDRVRDGVEHVSKSFYSDSDW